MLTPIVILAGILTVITTPGLIAQHLEARCARQAAETNEDGSVNA